MIVSMTVHGFFTISSLRSTIVTHLRVLVPAIIPDISVAWIGLHRDSLSNQFVWADDGTPVSETDGLTD